MKTFKTYLTTLRKKPIYTGLFTSREDVFSNFVKEDDSDIEIIYAEYESPDYEGYASVLYYRKSTKKYYQVYGGHCSCYGLEGQWDTGELISFIELENRILKGCEYFSGNALYKQYLKS